MDYRRLGGNGPEVSSVCLGTMTWGFQNSQAEAFEQMDYAVDQGITFFDTAEMYPVPPRGENFGKTEEIIGNWFQRTGLRDRIVLATKVAGRTRNFPEVRDGDLKADAKNIDRALTDSLRRLQTDWVDLYQIHWPDRQSNFFGKLGFTPPAPDQDEGTPIEDSLEALDKHVKAGKIRYIGLSNERPWGLHKFLKLAADKNLPRVVSVQNPYSLLDRTYEVGLAEMSWRENAGLLAYSPLAAGMLTGKYLGGQRPPGARLSNMSSSRYLNQAGERATAQYVELAKRYGLDPAQLAIAFTLRQPFLTASIIGATSMAQLRNNIAAKDVQLSDELLAEIEAIHRENPWPCP